MNNYSLFMYNYTMNKCHNKYYEFFANKKLKKSIDFLISLCYTIKCKEQRKGNQSNEN